ncbi:peptidylprolyl isomerase [Sphingomonas oligophenolica]|uniref:Peptidyl-prolyl cis-trans isomerase n=1 Tax=Sphingomonas oligophenolica TaxID=301154 RepID=A0A502CR60_9SPHN|nr:peptidylprolyl isomerase [Sphingomonas oligophenolica]TPG15313.1 peptidylprolyl isomerase [Sphingomonas oligophenolica]
MRLLASVLVLLSSLVALPVAAQQAEITQAPRGTPPLTTDKENLWLLDLSDGGRVTIWLRPDLAPKMVERVKMLTRQHFYDGLDFHRVIDGFMAQGGDPKGDGTGGSTLPNVPAEFSYYPHVRGAVSAARAEDENSANSQFFIVLQPRLSLDRKYTVFGRVVDGMNYVDAIQRGEPPANPTVIQHAYIAADTPPAYTPAPVAVAQPAGLAPVTLPGATTDKAAIKAAPAPK